jgi:predicted ATPase/class 3 adenylate cyclase
MNACPFCGFQNPEDIHICLRCAATLNRNCPQCGANVPAGNRFCGQCGARVEETNPLKNKETGAQGGENLQDRMLKDLRARMPASLATKMAQASTEMLGQRREVTVLFVDIANFTPASQILDSEDLYLATDEIMHLLVDAVYQFEGVIDKFTGDGLMALFGIPLNHENDPERAVRAALQMQQSLNDQRQALQERYHFDFQIRIGINTGSVIAGYLGSQQHLEYTVIGDTVNLASRLETFAQPGSILVSFSTYQRTRPIFEYQALPPLDLKGFAIPIQAYQPTGLRARPGQVRGLPGLQVPMIGRSDDLERLIQVYKQVAAERNSRIALISGDAGIGKSRLIAEFRNQLSGQAVNIYQGTCAAYMRITPYRVVADILRNLIHVSELDEGKIQREALQQHMEQLGLAQADILPYLLEVLGLLRADPVLEVRIKLLEPSMLQRQTHLALRTLLVAEARLAPTVLIFDDLHWVDPASRQFIENLCQSLEDVPILMILVAREFEKHDDARQIYMAASKHAQSPMEIELQPLSKIDSRLLVDQLIQETTAKAKAIKTTIVNRAGGNPYYTEELVRILMDHGGLVQEDGVWHVTAQADELIQEVPGTLQDLILARFDRLPDHLRQTLQKASTLGQSFAITLLQIFAQEEPETLRMNLAELEKRNFLIHAHFGNEEGYLFKHPLLQETIYNTLMKRDLRKFHYQIALAIESGEHWLPGERDEILAHHYAESTAPLKAIPYLLASAEKASQNFANESVVQLYCRALSLMETSPEVTLQQIDQARIGLGRALKFTGAIEEAAQMLNEVVERLLALETGLLMRDPEMLRLLVEGLRELSDIRARENNLDTAVQLLRAGLDLLGDAGRQDYPTFWRRLADRLAWVYFRQGKLDEAYNLADLALLDVKSWEMEDPITVASLWNTIGGVYYTRSRLNEAIESVERSLQIYKDLNYHWGMAVALNNLGILNFAFGKWEEAVNHLEQADRLRSEYGNDPERPINLKNLGEVLVALGDYARARVKMETSRSISERLGMDLAKTYAELGLCHLALKEENFTLAQSHLSNASQLIESSDQESDRACIFYTLKAMVEAQLGNLSQALEAAQKALQIAERSGFVGETTDALRGLGMTYRLLQQFELAETHLQKAIRVAQTRNDRYSEAEAIFELGLVYEKWSQSDLSRSAWLLKQAEFSLDKAIAIYENLGAKQDLRRARSARASLPSAQTIGISQEDSAEVSAQVARLRARLGLPEGEWYQAVVLSILLSPNQDEDEELIFETITFLTPSLVDMIQENGGQAIRLPDGITAIFGAPIAHEDDPERAVETAMQLLNFYNEIYLRTQLPVTLRLGMAMGKIVAGSSDLESEFLAAGEPLQFARAIAEASNPARLWVSQAVRNATAFRFDFTPVAADLQEHPTDQPLFQLEGLREQILPVRGLIGLKTAFVGRKSELAQMHQMANNLKQGYGGLVWLEGDAGIGKSRLMREFTAQMAGQHYLIWRGACIARRSDTAFSLFSDLLSNLLDIQPNFTPSQIYTQIDARLKRWPEELQEIRPFLQLLVGVQPSGSQAERVIELEPEQLRRQTFVALHRLISVLAAQQPIVMILDDVQWIDSTSADLLLYLSHLMVNQPVLFICAQRQGEISPYERTLARTRQIHQDQYLEISIKPLTLEECRTLLNEFLSTAEVPEALKSLIVHQSGGNPYFIEEFVRMLLEQDYLRLVRGRLEVNQELPMSKLAIPVSLESLIRARVDSLHASARQLLQVAAVIGQRFTRGLLMDVAAQENIDAHLEQLRTRGMLSLDAATGFWEFSHPMIEAIVYNTVLRAQRRILHSRTAAALEAQWRGNESEHAEDLAYHYRKAEDYNKALYYLILAGERAAARHANETAVNYFEQASDLLSAVPTASDELRYRIAYGLGEVYQFVGKFEASIAVLNASEDLMRQGQLTPAQRASLHRCLGDTLRKTSDYEQAIQALNQALEIIGSASQQEAAEEAARVYVSLGWSYFMQASWDEAKNAVLKAIDYALQAKATSALGMAENLLGGIYYRQGDLAQAAQHTRQAMSCWQEIGYSWGVAATMSNLGILEVSSGNWDAAFEAFQKSLKLRQEMGDVEGVAITQNNLGSLARDQGRMAQAEEYYRASLAVSQPFQMSWQTANSLMGLAQALLYQGKLDEACEPLLSGIHIASEINARDLLVEMQRTEAEIYLAQGNYTKAEQTAREAARLAGEIGSFPLEASAWRVVAACLLQQGQPQEALKVLDHAWQALVQGGDELETGRVHAQARIIAASLGRSAVAEKHLQTAREIFTRLGAARDLDLLQTEEGAPAAP